MKQENVNTNDGAASSSIAIDSVDNRPELLADRSFWGIATTQFLGAFNDNLFKQLILLLSVPAVVVGIQQAANANAGDDVQGYATAIFSLPFVILSGFAGFLSDRYSKQQVIFISKVAEIAIMFLGMFAFLMYGTFAALGTWSVLFLMATQSTFFGPGKYGILPELFRERDLAKANGLILMSTFLAIIFGTVVAGFLFDVLLVVDAAGKPQAQALWIGSCACILIAVVGTWTSTWIRRTAIAEPSSTLSLADWGLSAPMRGLLGNDRPLLMALLVSCVFWMVSGIAVPVVNRLGIGQLNVNKSLTSLLVAAIAIGIMLGSILAAAVFKKLKPRGQVTVGLWGLVASLLFLGCWTANGKHMFGYSGCFVLLIVLGVFAAIYAVPLQVFLQSRPPAELKGRMIGTMNQANFVGILLSGPLYQGFEKISSSMGWPISSVFWMLAVLVIPLAIFYRLGSGEREIARIARPLD
ncbi:MAG: MFS transporter [Pirellulaceae bacterium]|nr:MFS transporter [Pirellulaceae bacterium]